MRTPVSCTVLYPPLFTLYSKKMMLLIGSKKPLPGEEQRPEFTFTEKITCGLSGRINEKPGGDVLPSRPEPAGKVWPWWARGLREKMLELKTFL